MIARWLTAAKDIVRFAEAKAFPIIHNLCGSLKAQPATPVIADMLRDWDKRYLDGSRRV